MKVRYLAAEYGIDMGAVDRRRGEQGNLGTCICCWKYVVTEEDAIRYSAIAFVGYVLCPAGPCHNLVGIVRPQWEEQAVRHLSSHAKPRPAVARREYHLDDVLV